MRFPASLSTIKKTIACAALALAPLCAAAAPTPLDDMAAKSGAQAQNTFVWVDFGIEEKYIDDILGRKDFLNQMRPRQYDSDEARASDNLFASINRVSVYLLDKTKGIKQPTDTELAKMMGYVFSSYFGPLTLKFADYDPSQAVQRVRVVGYMMLGEAVQPFAVDVDLRIGAQEFTTVST